MGLLKIEAMIIASRKELGWFAVINTGPFIFTMDLFCIRNAGQKIATANRIKGFNK